MIYKNLVLIMLLVSLFGPMHAQQHMGGEITWACTPQGSYRFTMKLYRECYTLDTTGTATSILPNTLSISTTVPGLSSISMGKVSERELTPQCGCPGGVSYSCTGMSNGTANMGIFTEHVYTSDYAYPHGVTLQGVPPSNGWQFSYKNCCRSGSSNLNHMGAVDFFIQSVMYGYNNTPVNQCFDNSPTFAEVPASVGCIGKPVVYHHFATDKDGDELEYIFSPIFLNAGTYITNYMPGYGWETPLPGPFHDSSNTIAQLDTHTGIISFTSYTAGSFVVATHISSYRNGIKTARITRDLRFLLLPCTPNETPVYQLSAPLFQIAPDHYHASVSAGDTLQFSLQITDPDTCPGSTQPNSIWLTAAGEMFGQPIHPTPCPTPPCAELSPSPAASQPLMEPGILSTTFSWHTTTDHLDHAMPFPLPKTYYFYLFYQDDHCPTPAMGRILITVEVHPWVVPPANITCMSVLPNGDVELTWPPVQTPDTTFERYEIIASLNPDGPFAVLAQLTNINNTSFTHVVPTTVSQRYYYALISHINHPTAIGVPSETVSSSILLTATPELATTGNIALAWNSTHPAPVPGATEVYEIYRSVDTGGWNLITNTTNTHYTDNLPFTNQTAHYRIETEVLDTTGTYPNSCRSISNVAKVLLSSVEAPLTPDSLPILFPNPTNGNVTLHPGSLQGDATVQIIAADGSTVKHLQLMLEQSRPCQLELSGLAPGFYMVVLSTDHGHHTLKLVIE